MKPDKPFEFKLVASHPIYQGRVFGVRQDQVQMPNGHLARLDIVEHPPAVLLVPVDANGDIWFIHQYRHAAGQEILELPAGVMEPGESPERCAEREIREEIGMSASEFSLIGEFFMAPGYTTEYLYVFLARDLQSNPLPGDADEFIRVERMAAAQAFSMVARGEIHDSKTIAALLLAKTYLDSGYTV